MNKSAFTLEPLTEKWIARVLKWLQWAVFALPVLPVIYLQFWQDQTLTFVNHGFHGVVIVLVMLEGAGIGYVSWLCYRRSGIVLLRRLTQAFIGFTVVHSMHGIFTPIADRYMPLFLLYGPASRLVMGGCLLMAMLRVGQPADTLDKREGLQLWARWLFLLLGVNAFVALVALSSLASEAWVHLIPELLAAGCNLAALFLLYRMPLRSPLMREFGMALAWLVVASLSFALSSPWNHQWWLAHGLTLAGFSILGYGILKAYQTTRALDRVFTAEELFEDLAATNARLKESMADLASANVSLTQHVSRLDGAHAEFLNLVNVSPDGIVIVAAGGSVVRANAAATKLFGYPEHAMQGITVEELIPTNMRAAHKRERQLYGHLPSIREMGIVGKPLPCLRKDGTTFLAHISIGTMLYMGQRCAVTFIREAHPELTHFESLRLLDLADIERGALLRSVLATVPHMLFELQRLSDGQYRCLSFSTAALNAMHITPDQSGEQQAKQWFNQVMPADLPTVIEAIERAAQTKSGWQTQWRHHVYGVGLQRFQAKAIAPRLLPDGALGWLCMVEALKEAQQ